MSSQLQYTTLAQNDLPAGIPAFRYGMPEDPGTPYILFVHGWNLETWNKDRFAETAFKRLYWQGYRGRFGSFRWPTDFNFKGKLIDAILQPKNFDDSEQNAWLSGASLLDRLNQLHTTYGENVYLYAVSHGNVVCGEALRLAGTQLVNTYIASQGARGDPGHHYNDPQR
jgi:hypothetical protein